MPPSVVGTNRSAGQACTHSLVVQERHTSESTVMWARSPTRNSTLAIRSSKDTSAYVIYFAPSSICAERLPAVMRQRPHPDLVDSDCAKELPGHAKFGKRIGDGEHLLDEVADQPWVLPLHSVGEHDVGRVTQPLVVGEHETRLQ